VTEKEKRNLRIGDVVHTAHGNYCVVATDEIERTGEGTSLHYQTPVLVRCFRMRDVARYQNGFRPEKPRRKKRT